MLSVVGHTVDRMKTAGSQTTDSGFDIRSCRLYRRQGAGFAECCVFAVGKTVVPEYLDFSAEPQGGEIFPDGIAFGIIETGNIRIPDFYSAVPLDQIPEVVQNALIVNSGASAVDSRIDGFQIVEESIRIGKDILKNGAVRISAGIDIDGNPVVMENSRQCDGKFRLRQTFAAGQGDAAAACFKKRFVCRQDPGKGSGVVNFPVTAPCICHAFLSADKTSRAQGTVGNGNAVFHPDGMRRTDGFAAAAGDALVTVIPDFGAVAEAFRIVTPHTAQRTAFEKYRGTYTAAVMHRAAFDTADAACYEIGFRHLVYAPLSLRRMNSSCAAGDSSVKRTFQPHSRTCRFGYCSG